MNDGWLVLRDPNQILTNTHEENIIIPRATAHGTHACSEFGPCPGRLVSGDASCRYTLSSSSQEELRKEPG